MKKAGNLLFVLCFILFVISPVVPAISAEMTVKVHNDEFLAFIKKFCSDKEFQLSRVKFPLYKWVIITDPSLVEENGPEDMEGNPIRKVPVDKSEWKFLNMDVFTPVYYPNDNYESKWVEESADKIHFISGWIDSTGDYSAVFEKINGEWYLTDYSDLE